MNVDVRARSAAARQKEAAAKLGQVAEEATDNTSEVEISNENVDKDEAEKATNFTEEDSIEKKAADEATSDNEVSEEPTENTVEVVEDVPLEFCCDQSNNKFSSLIGLRTHKGKVHKSTGSPIPQLDGADDE